MCLSFKGIGAVLAKQVRLAMDFRRLQAILHFSCHCHCHSFCDIPVRQVIQVIPAYASVI